MKRMVFMLALALLVGVALGVIGDQVLNAQQQPVKRTELLTTDLAGLEGKEGVVYIAEIAPGAAAAKHYHPGHELAYTLSGSWILQHEGKPPITLKAGQAVHNPSKVVHTATNASKTQPVKILVVLIKEKGQPLAVSVQ